MEPLLALAALLLAAFGAGIAGAYLGVGGGIFLIPFMTLALGVPIQVAIATSLVGVIATSSGSASVYVRDHLTNLRLGMFLEVGTTLGAIAGAFIALLIPDPAILFMTFGILVLFVATRMVRGETVARGVEDAEPSPLANRLHLGDRFRDAHDGHEETYQVSRVAAGAGISAVAGAISGLLGVGGGFIKVPAMNVVMRVPMKAAVATSNFMIGVTAAASAFIYYARGVIDPSLAAMLVLGVFTGTRLGTRYLAVSHAMRVRVIFAVLLAGVGVFMIARAIVPGVGF